MPEIDPSKLKYHRKMSSLRQYELAERLGWSQSRLSQYENPNLPDRKEINGDSLEELAKAIGCDKSDIIKPKKEAAQTETNEIDLALWKKSIQAINAAEKKLNQHLTEDQKLNAALHLYTEKIANEKRISLRSAAYLLGIGRVGRATVLGGI